MACVHQTPRLDGILLKGCDECEPVPSRGPSFQFTYGKEDFHGPTIRERVEEHVAANEFVGRKMGVDYEPAGARWV